ncbi:MAG: hypothetical protein ACERJ2_17325, partial [Filomicrobium sp.]
MVSKSLDNPYDGNTDLRHGADCGCRSCSSTDTKSHAAHEHNSAQACFDDTVPTSEELLERAVESAVVRSIFGHNELSRRSFASMLGASTLAAAIGSVFPMDAA